MMASPIAEAAGWSREELLAAQAEGALLDVVAPGIEQCAIVSVREADVVVTTRFHATAYVQFGAIRSAPRRFAAGDKVATPYGVGVVAEVRPAAAAADRGRCVVVKFLDKGAVGASRGVLPRVAAGGGWGGGEGAPLLAPPYCRGWTPPRFLRARVV